MESETRFRDLVEGSVDGIIVHRDFKALFVNDAFAKIFGFDSPEDVLALDSVLEMVPPDVQAQIKAHAKMRMDGDDVPTEYEIEGVKKDGSSIWLVNLVRVISWNGQPAIQSTVLEITQRKRMEEELRQARDSLERVRHRQNQKGDSQGSQKVIQAMRWVKGGQPWMTRPYSEDLRERVVRVVESGTSRNAAAKQFDVSISFVVKLMQRWKQRGTIKADKYGGWKKSKLAPHGDRIRALVMENCDITIDELCVLLAAEGIEAKRSTLGDFLLAQGLSRKKRQPTPPSRSALTSRRREPLGATSNLG